MLLILQDGIVKSFQQLLAHFQLGVLVREHVDLLQLPRGSQRGALQFFGSDDFVEEACINGTLRIEHLAIDHRTMESRTPQAITRQLDTGVVHGHADLHFVQADAERAVDTDAVIGGQQQESALGHSVPRQATITGNG